jgi:hypothetical protein
MKILTLASVLLILPSGLMAQTSLTYSNNALIAGDSFVYKEIQFPEPGNAGPNQIWDFSRIQFTGKIPASKLQTAIVPKTIGVGAYNLSLSENGYEYFMNSSEGSLEELGYVNKELKLTLRYSDPVLKMKYPFAYGGQFTDHFIGIASYDPANTIDFFGDCTVTADAYGKLILPDRIIENTLRIKSVKTGLQINMCGTTDVKIVKYNWYAPGYRYPLLTLNKVENRPSVGIMQTINTAFINTQQQIKTGITAQTKISSTSTDPVKEIPKQDVSVTLSPNPFTDKCIYDYFLSEPASVSIELYNISGKTIAWLVKDQVQSVGLQTGEINSLMYTLTPGVYLVRFTFDKQIVIGKIVKI